MAVMKNGFPPHQTTILKDLAFSIAFAIVTMTLIRVVLLMFVALRLQTLGEPNPRGSHLHELSFALRIGDHAREAQVFGREPPILFNAFHAVPHGS